MSIMSQTVCEEGKSPWREGVVEEGDILQNKDRWEVVSQFKNATTVYLDLMPYYMIYTRGGMRVKMKMNQQHAYLQRYD